MAHKIRRTVFCLIGAAACLAANPGSAPAENQAAGGLRQSFHFSGMLATRYLHAPYLRRQAVEYLYVFNTQFKWLKRENYGSNVNATLSSFDKRRFLRGFAATGMGPQDAESVLNFNRLYLEGYYQSGPRKLNLQFGVLPIDLPTISLPLSLGQVGNIAGLRVDATGSARVKTTALAGHLDTRIKQDVPHKDDGLFERYNYVNPFLTLAYGPSKTTGGVYLWDPRNAGYEAQSLSVFLQEQYSLVKDNWVGRAHARYIPSRDEFSSAVFSLEVKFWKNKLSLRPGYFYFNRDPKIVHLPNSNYFAPGADTRNVFLLVQAAFPTSTDMLYAGATTSASDDFLGKNSTRFEIGLFHAMPSIPFLP